MQSLKRNVFLSAANRHCDGSGPQAEKPVRTVN